MPIEDFLVDFYSKNTDQEIDQVKVDSIVDYYGGDNVSMIKDLYEKYDTGNIDNDKFLEIKEYYSISEPKKEEVKEIEEVEDVSNPDFDYTTFINDKKGAFDQGEYKMAEKEAFAAYKDTGEIDLTLFPKEEVESARKYKYNEVGGEYYVDNVKLSRVELKDKLFDGDFINKLQEGKVDIKIKDDERLEELAKKQLESGGQWGDKWEGLKAAGLSLGKSIVSAPTFIEDVFAEVTGVENVFGAEDRVVRDAIVKSVNNRIDELHDNQRAYENDFRGSIGEFLKTGNINGLVDAGNIGFNTVVESAPIMVASTAAAIASGGSSVVVQGLASAGVMSALLIPGEYTDSVFSEDEKVQNLSRKEKLARGFFRGLSEGVFEGVMGPAGGRAFGLFKSGLRSTAKVAAKQGGKKAGEIVAKEMANKTAVDVLKTFGIDSGKEGFTEALTSLSQDLTDDILGVQNLSISEYMSRASEAGALGIFMGGFIQTTGGVARKTFDLLPLRNQKVYQGSITDIRKRQELGTMSKEEGDRIINDIEEYKSALEKTDSKLDDKQQNKIANLIYERNILEENIKKLDPNQQSVKDDKARVDNINKEISELSTADAVNVDLAEKGAKVRKNQVDIKTKDTIEFAETQGKKLNKKVYIVETDLSTGETGNQKAQKIFDEYVKENPGTKEEIVENADGYRIGDIVVLNKDIMQQTGALDVGSHEIFHVVVDDYFEGLDIEARRKLIKDFKNLLSDEQRSAVEERINENYSDIDAEASIEWFNAFSDAIQGKKITFDEGVGDKILNFVQEILRKVGVKKEFSNARQAYNFMKDFSKSVSKGELSERALKLSKSSESKASDLKLSKTKENKEIKEIFDEFTGPAENRKFKSKEEFKGIPKLDGEGKIVYDEKNEIVYSKKPAKEFFDALEEIEQSKTLDASIRNTVSQSYLDMNPGFVKEVKEKISDKFKSEYDASKNSLFGWLTGKNKSGQPLINLATGDIQIKRGKKPSTVSADKKIGGEDSRVTIGETLVSDEISPEDYTDMMLAKDKLKKIKPQQSKIAKKIDLSDNEINLVKRDITNFLRKKDRPAMTDPKKFFKAFVDYVSTATGNRLYDKLSAPKDGLLSTKNRKAFIESIAEDLIALNKVDPSVMRRSNWTPFYELEIKRMNPTQTQKAIDEGRVPSTVNLKAGNDLFKTLNPSTEEVVDYLMGIRPDVLKRKMPKFLAEVIAKNEFNNIVDNPKQPVYDTKGDLTDRTIDLSENITEEEIIRGAPQVIEKIARPEGVKFSKSKYKEFSIKEVDQLIEIAQASDINAAGVIAGIPKGSITVTDKNRPAKIKQVLKDIIQFKLTLNTFESSMPASAGAVRFRVGKSPSLDTYLAENKIKSAEGDVWYKLTDGTYAKGVYKSTNIKGIKTFGPPVNNDGKPLTNLTPARGRLYYGKEDPNYIEALEAVKKNTKKDALKPKKVPVRDRITKAFISKFKQRSKDNMKVLEDVAFELNDAVGNGMPASTAALIIAQGYQATDGLIKISAPFSRVSRFFKYGPKESKQGDRSKRPFIEEHNPPASTIGATLIWAIANNKTREIFPYIKRNYFQTQLSKASDYLLDVAMLDKRLPKGTSILDNSVMRLAIAGINLNNIIDPVTGKSEAEIFNVGVSSEYRNNPDVVAFQNSLIEDQIVDGLDPKAAKELLNEYLKLVPQKTKAGKFSKSVLSESKVLNLDGDLSMQELLDKAANIDKALSIARDINAPVKKIRVFDFDDTLATTKSNVLFTAPDGTEGSLTAEKFAMDGARLLEEGYSFDFTEFDKVTKGKPGPLLNLAKKIQNARGTEDVFVLTARGPQAAIAIKEFLDSQGLDIPLKNITGLGKSTGEAKANWMVDKAAEGYNDFYFADDAKSNVKAVRDVLEVIDVKSKVQQAKFSKTKDLSSDFNKLIEESTGIEAEKVFSDVKANLRGGDKKGQRFFIPSSAEDMLGLVYTTLGKGKKGEASMKFYQENLFDPYTKAMDNLSTDRVNLMADFKALKKELNVPKDLQKTTKSGFTNEQAVRVYLWNKAGEQIPGLSKADLKELSDIVENNPKLKVFADQIMSITKGDGYSTPKDAWALGTITTDLIDILNTTKRGKYLESWNQNVDLIYSKDNLNKLEAAYGKKYRDALENSLSRMKSGSNRLTGGNKLSNDVLDYINNSTAVTMFVNVRSALLQTLSAANFINWSFNNPLKAGKAFANQPQFWKDFSMLMNSDYLVDRRNGLKLNINESEIANAAKTSKNKAKAALNYILEKGYLPTKYADSFAIASGGATFYRNRIKDLVRNEGKTNAEAEVIAMKEFRQVSETSQQSSDPSKISSQQSSDLGRVVLQFANTPMQYARIQKRAVQDIVNGRGDLKTNISKIAYYAFAQNLMFNALQNGLFALGFGDTDIDEKEEKSIVRTANGMMDSILRGLGFAGVTVQVLKNLGIDIYDRSKKNRPEYGDAYKKLLDFSPAIKSKLGKFSSAGYPFETKKKRAEVFDKGFSLDNPAYESMAKVITGTTNLPLDRLYSKVNNLKAASDEETETWQSIAMVLGWPEWQIKGRQNYVEAPKTDEEKIKIKEERSKTRLKEAKGSTDFKTLKKLNKEEQLRILKNLGVGNKTLKRLKKSKEADLIKEIIKRNKKKEQ